MKKISLIVPCIVLILVLISSCGMNNPVDPYPYVSMEPQRYRVRIYLDPPKGGTKEKDPYKAYFHPTNR